MNAFVGRATMAKPLWNDRLDEETRREPVGSEALKSVAKAQL